MTHTYEQNPLSSHLASKTGPSIYTLGRMTFLFSHQSCSPSLPSFSGFSCYGKPINWLLSNCLSFRLCPCPGLSVQTQHPAGGETPKTHKNCPDQKDTSAPRLKKLNLFNSQRLRHICGGGGSGHTGKVKYPKAAQ